VTDHQPLLPSRRGFLVASALAAVPALWAAPALAGPVRTGVRLPWKGGAATPVTLPWYDLTNQTVTAAAQQVLTAFLGPQAPAPIPLTSPNDPGVPRTYTD